MRDILVTSSVLILALLILRRVFRKTISRRVQYALWGLVLVRLLVPVSLPAMEHNVLTTTEPVRTQFSQQLERQEIYIPTDREPLEDHLDAPDLTPDLAIPASSSQVWVIEDDKTAVQYQKLTSADLLRWVWYIGMGVMACWLVISNLRFWRKLCKARIPYRVEHCRYPVYVVESGLPSPCLFGLFRPAIYLTPAAVSSPEKLRHVLAHEETHARHLDPLWSALRGVCLAVYWFDPLVWAAALASRTDCELACDEGALKRLGDGERIPYGQTLLALIPVRKGPSSPLLTATTMTADKRRLKDRITRIAENRRTVTAAVFLALALAALVCAVTFTGAKAGSTPLTQEELDFFNAEFFGSEADPIRGQFLTSLYGEPEEINMFSLFYNGTGRPTGVSDEERQVVADTFYDGAAPWLDLIKLPAADVDAVLQRYTGLTLAQTQAADMGAFHYLADYDAYYYYRNDIDTIENITFTLGERKGDTIRLYYHNGSFGEGGPGGWKCVTLREVPGEFEDGFPYHIVSHTFCDRPDHLMPENWPLSDIELAFFNEEFFESEGFNILPQFLTSLYAQPEDIDLFQLFYNGTGLFGAVDEAERRDVVNQCFQGADPEVDLTKLPAREIDQLLERYTGLTLAQTRALGMDGFQYLADYDAYYHFHGDTNAPGTVTFAAGEREGDLIRLYYKADGMYLNGEFAEGWACLTLREVPGEAVDSFPYRIVSHQLCDQPDHLLDIRPLTGEELTYFNEVFFNAPTPEDGQSGICFRNQFLTALYERPEEIDLFALFYLGVPNAAYPGSIQTSNAEEDRLVYGDDLPDCARYKATTADLDALLRKYTGLTLAETNQVDLSAFTYLPEYDAYYWAHGDTNYHTVTFFAGEREGGTVRLYYTDDWFGPDMTKCVTLEAQEDGSYWFVSHLFCDRPAIATVYPDWDPVLTIPLDDLTPYTAPEVTSERHAADSTEALPGIQVNGWIFSLCRTYEGTLRAAVQQPGAATFNCFLSFPEQTEADVTLEGFQNLFGHDGVVVSYTGMLQEESAPSTISRVYGQRNDYFYITENGTPALLARTFGTPALLDLDGDGENELTAVSSETAQVFFQRDGQLYEADVLSLLADAWPEMRYWDWGDWDISRRCLTGQGFVKMPGWEDSQGGTGEAWFWRDIYFDGENLLVYRLQTTTADHMSSNVSGDLPPEVLAAARAQAQEAYEATKNGREDALSDQSFDDWRVSSLSLARTSTDYGSTLEIYALGYQFHSKEPGKVMLAGGMYVDEDGWVGGFYTEKSPYLVFQVQPDGGRRQLESNLPGDASVDSPAFEASLAKLAMDNGLTTLTETDSGTLLHMFYDNPWNLLNTVGQAGETEQRALVEALESFHNRGLPAEEGLLRDAMQTVAWNPHGLTEAGRAVWLRLIERTDIHPSGIGISYDSLFTAIQQSILAHRRAATAKTYACYTAAYRILDRASSGSTCTVYLQVVHGQYDSLEAGPDTGGEEPAALTFATVNGLYQLTEYHTFAGGGEFVRGIQACFPAEAAEIILGGDGQLTAELTKQCEEQAVQYFTQQASARFSKADVEFDRQALTVSQDEMTYDQRWDWCEKGGDTGENIGFAVNTAQTTQDGYIAYAGNMTGVPPDASAWKELYLRFKDGTLANLPLPKSAPYNTTFMDTALFTDGKFVYSVHFPDELVDGETLVHLKGTYRYEVDLSGKTVSLTVLDT